MPAAFRPATQGSDRPLPALLDDDPRVRIVAPGQDGHRGSFVLYWPQVQRRASGNAALSMAIARANALGLPLAVYEALRVDYPHASERVHAFVLEGARAEAQGYRARGAAYAFFLPRSADEARGVVARLARQAALIVTDDSPAFVVPGHLSALGSAPCPVWAVDDNVVVPLALLGPEQYAARTLRPRVARLLDAWLRPLDEPSCDAGPARVDWPFEPLDVERLATSSLDPLLASLPIDHEVRRSWEFLGGSAAASARLGAFLRGPLRRYHEPHHPDEEATTGLSPYLHFGMIGARQVALAVRQARAPEAARNALLEQLLVRRALAFNLARENPQHRLYEALPAWARATLDKHLGDLRPHLYSREQLERAQTHDPVWNAAQSELRVTGVIQGYLRMLWGKCVIAWKASPQQALGDLIALNDRWALDGRDPSSYANILWCFGKHDRPWGPEREIFGTVRTMSTAAARRKLHMEKYLARWLSRA